MAELLLSNLLKPDFPNRARIERAVRSALEKGGADPSWSARMQPSDDPDRVSIDVVFPKGGVAATSVAIQDDEESIARQVSLMLQPFCGR